MVANREPVQISQDQENQIKSPSPDIDLADAYWICYSLCIIFLGLPV